jgi:hypothetical protein
MIRNIPEVDDNNAITVFADALREDFFAKFNCHRIGIIDSFDPNTCTATIKLVDKRVNKIGTQIEITEYQPLLEVPVYMPSNNAGGLNLTLQSGDECLLLFNDRDITKWQNNGIIQEPQTSRKHDWNDAIAIVGLHSGTNILKKYQPNSTILWHGDNTITINNNSVEAKTSGGAEIIMQNDIEVKSSANDSIILGSNKIEAESQKITLKTTTTAQIEMDNLIQLKNAVANYHTIFTLLINAFINGQFVDNPQTPTIVTVPAQNLVTQLQTVLQQHNQLFKQ